MKIQNKFSELIKKGIKTIEIRKEDSFQKVVNQNMSIGLGTGNHIISPKGLLIVNMEIVDCSHYKADRIEQDNYAHKIDCNYKIVFNGYQRIRVSELKRQISLVNEIKDYKDNEFKLRFKYSPEFWRYKLSWIVNNNLNWLFNNKKWLFDEYLKDEEYCIIYFIDKEETFKANDWNK